MSRFKRFIKWLLFGTFHTSKPLGSIGNIQNSEKKNEFIIGRIDLIGCIFCNHFFGIPNRTASTAFESETGQGYNIGDDAGDLSWRRPDYLDADSDSYEIGGELSGFEEALPLFNNDDHFYRAYTTCGVNPANGLPMLDDCIDIHGNPYGTDFSDSDSFHCGHNLFDSFGEDGFGSTTTSDILGLTDSWGS